MQNIIVTDASDLEKKFFNSFKERNFLFEISKCCGYSELVNCTKEDTLKKLYENVAAVFCKEVNLYVFVEGKRLWIPNSETKVKKYLKEMESFLKPEYPMPSRIIYKIYLDDGHCHIDHHKKEELPYANVCVKCLIHPK